ncbi:murein biosynthesis integral membrane protein MurJ [Treponema zuelzerae]|uniref:Probable lipid II flippase MurJ n=1 Tax=Teretinema zuelzerae TaxID=156 RepID=A0AAE3JM56_9SPIR|nr:murein biosynthesis integral membrane protein MurJ [Teretinema zuelzerae]MCD1655409.1 murein biosynthesis integral membrane protein MurJ [Teretinema zuelzerae]
MAKSLVKSGSSLLVLTLGSRVLGLIREMTKAAFLGTSALSDAFSVAFVIPNLLRKLFAENSVSVAFIPTFRSYLDEKSADETRQFVSATFTFLACVTSLTTALGMLAAPLIVPFFGTPTGETVLLTRIMFPYLAIISIAALLQGILNGLKIFSPSGFTPILFNLCIIGLTWLLSPFTENPARAMAIGVIAGGTLQAAFQLPFVLKQGYALRFVSLKKAFTNPGTKRVIRLVGPTIIGMAAYQLNDLVSTILAGNAGPGVVSSLGYSLRLQELILGVFAVSIGTVILPDLSAQANKKDWAGFAGLLSVSMKIIALITIPVTFFSLICGENIIRLVFQTRSFTEESVRLTLSAFTWHIAGLYFIALNRIVAPAFYAQQDTKSPTYAGLFSFIVNIALALVLVGPMRGGGIALALSLASAANTAFLFLFMRKNGSISAGSILRSTVGYTLKMALFSALAAWPAALALPRLQDRFAGSGRLIAQGVPLAGTLFLFAAAGVLLLAITRDRILLGILSKLKNRGSGKN